MADRETFLELIWNEIIDPCAEGHWIDNSGRNVKGWREAPFGDLGPAVKRLLKLGASRADLCSIARWASYEAAFAMTMLLEDPGIRRSEIAGLHESLLSADPSGREGRPQPAPKDKASKPTPRSGSGGKREPAGKAVVYETARDFKHFQYFLPKSAADFDLLRLAGDSRTFKWNPPQVVIKRSVSKRKRGDTWNFNPQPLIFSMRAAEALERLLKPVGRLLPLVHEGEEYRVLQVTSVIDCLDPSQTLVRYYDDTPESCGFGKRA